jgi:thiamine-monophosphate kinase
MIDVSDGLVQDLGHICVESAVGAVIHTNEIPLSSAYRRVLGADATLALRGGEDYELLWTVPQRHMKRLEGMRSRLGCPFTCIGAIVAGSGVRLIGADGRDVHLNARGYDHFGSRW